MLSRSTIFPLTGCSWISRARRSWFSCSLLRSRTSTD